jgi:hypothetical protein
MPTDTRVSTLPLCLAQCNEITPNQTTEARPMQNTQRSTPAVRMPQTPFLNETKDA